MPDIQIDMFEVQLGAAILLQFAVDDGRPVRVLADAGIKASGYEITRVRDRLLQVLGDGSDRRIDLIIGTHYDEDHLNGLVSIINDSSIAIGEAWMPPIANDSVPHAIDAALSPSDLLTNQFYGDASRQSLARYLAVKRADCQTLQILERPESIGDQPLNEFRRSLLARDESNEDIGFFRKQLTELISDDDCDHGTDQEIDPDPEVELALRMAGRSDWVWNGPWFDLDSQVAFTKDLHRSRPEVAEAQARSLANIRKGAAKDAINAKALHDVMQALRRRNIPICSEIIEDGTPRRYAWRQRERRFVAGASPTRGPDLVLLGPSHSLVRKHWNRLPVEDASRVALAFFSEIKSITPSNQLSYIARFGFADQGILISGDAGCVDFKAGGGEYYPSLLNAMLPLHVVQVAHHGGNNAHFYRVLSAAKFPEQRARSLLLLSHATDDKKRPSPQFREFILSTLRQGDDIQLLFTSSPTRDKVSDYRDAIHPVVGAHNDVGDVRIVFDRQRWEVKAHAVAP